MQYFGFCGTFQCRFVVSLCRYLVLMKYVQVVVFKKLGEFDNELTYSLSDEYAQRCQVGCLAEVAIRQKKMKGIVMAISDIPPSIDIQKIKPVSDISPNPLFCGRQIDLAKFIASYYQASMGKSLRLFLPKMLWNGKTNPPADRYYRLLNSDSDLRGEKQRAIVDVIRKNSAPVSFDQLKVSIAGLSFQTLKSLLQKKVIEEFFEPTFKPFNPDEFICKESDFKLTDDQQAALENIQKSDKPILLHGVTGSGKTEIYLRQILEIAQKGQQTILLVPEIALTPQMVRYFQGYFKDHIAVFHSKLSDGERLSEWWKVKTGYAPLVIGSRSAIFAPVQDLGLIILDEEHEWTYKQESAPYYQTQRIAEELQKMTKAKLILGSATPSAESYHKAQEGDYVYVDLPNRIHQTQMPAISIVDLRDEFKKRNFSVLSLVLQKKIAERLDANEQVILFVNQRGLSNAVTCRDCGYTERCLNCEISLKYHRYYQAQNSKIEVRNSKFKVQNFDRLVCHYCNYSKAPELLCPECRSPHIKHIGVGTQRVEEEIKKLYPKARTVRADRDTTGDKGGFATIYHDFLEHKYDVLVGTQMIAKGLDFSKVSLIGVVLADIGLHLPDFRASERLFQIITQVAGRCGRRETRGEVILQTYNPDHPTIKQVAEYAYKPFIEKELEVRKKLNYPPFNRMIKFTVVGSEPKKLSEHIQQEQEVLEDIFKTNDLNVKIISAPALIPKMANRYYYHVLLRSEKPDVIFDHWKPPRGWRIDIDPIHTV